MFFVLREVAFQPFVIPSSSMVPTLKIDEKILVDKTGIVSNGVKRGDIVVFRDPGLWLGPARYNPLDILGNISNLLRYGLEPAPSHLVKRVVAIGGDRVRCCSKEGQLVVNGAVISEPYILSPEGNASSIPFDVSVPADSFWVLGDNREGSADSRFHVDLPSQGFVKRRDVVGVVLGVFWPMQDFRWLSGANDFVKNIDNQSKRFP
jgi:signal peptidase I